MVAVSRPAPPHFATPRRAAPDPQQRRQPLERPPRHGRALCRRASHSAPAGLHIGPEAKQGADAESPAAADSTGKEHVDLSRVCRIEVRSAGWARAAPGRMGISRPCAYHFTHTAYGGPPRVADPAARLNRLDRTPGYGNRRPAAPRARRHCSCLPTAPRPGLARAGRHLFVRFIEGPIESRWAAP